MNSVCTYNLVKFVIYILASPEKSYYIKSQGIVPVLSLTDYFHREFYSDNDPSLGLRIYFFYREY